jgi:hypothetical protein
MSTIFTIELEDMDEVTAGGFGLWLDMIIREETEHTVRKLSFKL